ncbi:hypothetical protein Acr_00g0077750 [Actinidia rufa]|uniref:Uncharacterized protein n=1 Tax=Actinidia rufa TaxID=165716 RepID=A0A7J0DV60_9ERIC|nr:hypothetical protein Acr_00g0077750 [Actinidia rufa]
MLGGRPRATLSNGWVNCSPKELKIAKLPPSNYWKPIWQICNKFWWPTTRYNQLQKLRKDLPRCGKLSRVSEEYHLVDSLPAWTSRNPQRQTQPKQGRLAGKVTHQNKFGRKSQPPPPKSYIRIAKSEQPPQFQRSLGSFYQLSESFVARFIINTKAPKGVSSFLIIRKGKNESLQLQQAVLGARELYNEIKECLEELSLVIYLRLPPVEKLWKNLTLNPLDELHDLMSRVEMFAHLEDNVRKAERATRISFKGNSKFKHRESTRDREDRAGHLKEYIDHEKTKVEKIEVRPNLRGPNHPDLENRIWERFTSFYKCTRFSRSNNGEEAKARQFEPGSITFTKANLERVQHPHNNSSVIQLRVHNYDVKRILVDT